MKKLVAILSLTALVTPHTSECFLNGFIIGAANRIGIIPNQKNALADFNNQTETEVKKIPFSTIKLVKDSEDQKYIQSMFAPLFVGNDDPKTDLFTYKERTMHTEQISKTWKRASDQMKSNINKAVLHNIFTNKETFNELVSTKKINLENHINTTVTETKKLTFSTTSGQKKFSAFCGGLTGLTSAYVLRKFILPATWKIATDKSLPSNLSTGLGVLAGCYVGYRMYSNVDHVLFGEAAKRAQAEYKEIQQTTA